ncbi:cuticle protein 1 [Sipha flava]|uniref:Cuticle protein 1 n=1 Tax=Sipha flava TaxID=143950 RepID=A0A8B8FP91_9HEMI|nr:cuticle protein 1 [Sipha flava]
MFAIIAIVFAVQATAVLAGARYPSGLNPALCPNYPHCDNVLLAAYAQPGANDYSGQYNNNNNDDTQHYGSGYQRHPAVGAYSHYRHQQPSVPLPYTEPGYPAGLSSSNCPNYPYCSHQVPAEALKYEAHNRYPAGVTPHNCPNYPYCY